MKSILKQRIQREIGDAVQADLRKKLVLLTGPRQCGKTTFSRSLFQDYDYLNYDVPEDRLRLMEGSWDRKKPLVIFDELHKKKNWKSWLKGVVDAEKRGDASYLVTGSARLDLAKKVGDSLAGRYFTFRMHPFDLKELSGKIPGVSDEEILARLQRVGGFPEPFLEGIPEFYGKWKRSHSDIILRQDLIEFETVKDISSIELLIQLLRSRVGSTVSYASLARDLERDPKTVKRWLDLLENLYLIFKVTPFHKNVARSFLKEPKYYFYDTGQVQGDAGAVFENLVACALFKEIHFREDTKGESWGLHFLRTKEGREIDFLLLRDGRPVHLIEVKAGDTQLTPHLGHFRQFLPKVPFTQLVGADSAERVTEKTWDERTELRWAGHWLKTLEFGV